MCRILVYKGEQTDLDTLLYQPSNSLIHQSYLAKERQKPVNGDGFGVGWYAEHAPADPLVFVSQFPAWSEENLKRNASKIRSTMFCAHIRDATTGAPSNVNCHPFKYKQFLMMHNGKVGGFLAIKREIQEMLSDEFYHWIQGSTDSEHLFALFLDQLFERKAGNFTKEDLGEALKSCYFTIRELQQKHGVEDPSLLNLAITDSNFILASRFISDPDARSNTLYYSTLNGYHAKDGVLHLDTTKSSPSSVIIASEKLTDDVEDWVEIPINSIVYLENELTPHVIELPKEST